MLDHNSIVIFLLLFASIGLLDEVFYHHLKFNLFGHKECLKENILHTSRALIYSILFIVVANFHVYGLLAYCMLGILVLDIIVAVWDILEEPKSRKKFGGLSAGEYLLHMILSFYLGIFYFNYVSYLVPKLDIETGYSLTTEINIYAKYGLTAAGLGCLLMFIYSVFSLSKRSINSGES